MHIDAVDEKVGLILAGAIGFDARLAIAADLRHLFVRQRAQDLETA